MEKVRKVEPNEFKCLGCGTTDNNNEFIKDHNDKRSWICTDCIIRYVNEALHRLKPELSFMKMVDKIDERRKKACKEPTVETK